MENIKVYNQDGNPVGEVAVPKFSTVPWKKELVHQVFKALAANQRRPIAHTKNRGEVSGGGKKPWRQKGTGRARQGSIRSPLWRHGGVTFGPRNTTDWSQKINQKMKAEALWASLAKKLTSQELKVADFSLLDATKTKNVARMLKNLVQKYSVLLVVSEKADQILRSAANIEKVKGIKVGNLNVYDVLTHKYILIDQKALPELNYE